ncbi:helix-turn-helix transcriptional regulator [Bradyrhizobium sp. UFLA01-814]|uniref:helix-turn-helix domain-containing protein n=1 Tax=Bradyrhizobium sp. UFLA01-814 TaxID=3023480 RepID=UPI00398ADABD
MAKELIPTDPKVIEAEENLLIDFQIAIQEMMFEKNVNRSQLAERAGISKARLSQILGNEANPTVKSMARLFHALNERAVVSRAPTQASFESASKAKSASGQDWKWSESTGEVRIDAQFVAVIKDTGASNDNYHDRFLLIDSELTLEVA